MSLPFDVVVVTNRHKKALTLDCLCQIPHQVSVTPDYTMPDSYPLFLTGQFRCFRGHQDALRLSRMPVTLVLEDDAVPNRQDWLDIAIRSVALTSKFEIVSLHSRDRKPEQWTRGTVDGVGNFLYRGRNEDLIANGSMAYLITQKAKERFLAMPWDGCPQDVLIANRFNFCTLEDSPFHHDRKEGSLIDIWAGSVRLHLGCGPYRMQGWVNHDREVDLTKPLPYKNESIDRIFSEHVVEHLPQREAWNFLEECHRILKPGGVIRTVVPSLVRMEEKMSASYITFLKEKGWGDGSRKSSIKHIVFLHEHQSLWTADLLATVKRAVGFNAYQTELYESRFPDMRNLEQHGKSIGKENNEIESISVEGVK